jgi:hypothetical protein
MSAARGAGSAVARGASAAASGLGNAANIAMLAPLALSAGGGNKNQQGASPAELQKQRQELETRKKEVQAQIKALQQELQQMSQVRPQ